MNFHDKFFKCLKTSKISSRNFEGSKIKTKKEIKAKWQVVGSKGQEKE